MVARNALVGVALSYSEGDATFGANSGHLKTTETLGVVYTTVALSPNWYVNASAGYGDIDHTNFVRQLVLPTTTITATSSPQGAYRGTRVGGGWIGDLAGGKGGPYISLSNERISVGGFTEADSPMSLSFGDLSYRTQRLTVGGAWSQTKPVGQWRFFGRVAIDRDLKSDDLRIKLGPTAASLGTVEVPRPQRTSWNATLGLSLPDSLWAVNVGMGGPNGKLEAYTLGLSYKRAF